MIYDWSAMTSVTSKPCSCGGTNPNCFKCDGTGEISSGASALPKNFIARGLSHDGHLSSEDLRVKRVREQQAAADEEWAASYRMAQREGATYSRDLGTPITPSKCVSENFQDGSPTYSCITCSYELILNPLARCPNCNVIGPYELSDSR